MHQMIAENSDKWPVASFRATMLIPAKAVMVVLMICMCSANGVEPRDCSNALCKARTCEQFQQKVLVIERLSQVDSQGQFPCCDVYECQWIWEQQQGTVCDVKTTFPAVGSGDKQQESVIDEDQCKRACDSPRYSGYSWHLSPNTDGPCKCCETTKSGTGTVYMKSTEGFTTHGRSVDHPNGPFNKGAQVRVEAHGDDGDKKWKAIVTQRSPIKVKLEDAFYASWAYENGELDYQDEYHLDELKNIHAGYWPVNEVSCLEEKPANFCWKANSEKHSLQGWQQWKGDCHNDGGVDHVCFRVVHKKNGQVRISSKTLHMDHAHVFNTCPLHKYLDKAGGPYHFENDCPALHEERTQASRRRLMNSVITPLERLAKTIELSN